MIEEKKVKYFILSVIAAAMMLPSFAAASMTGSGKPLGIERARTDETRIPEIPVYEFETMSCEEFSQQDEKFQPSKTWGEMDETTDLSAEKLVLFTDYMLWFLSHTMNVQRCRQEGSIRKIEEAIALLPKGKLKEELLTELGVLVSSLQRETRRVEEFILLMRKNREFLAEEARRDRNFPQDGLFAVESALKGSVNATLQEYQDGVNRALKVFSTAVDQ